MLEKEKIVCKKGREDGKTRGVEDFIQDSNHNADVELFVLLSPLLSNLCPPFSFSLRLLFRLPEALCTHTHTYMQQQTALLLDVVRSSKEIDRCGLYARTSPRFRFVQSEFALNNFYIIIFTNYTD